MRRTQEEEQEQTRVDLEWKRGLYLKDYVLRHFTQQKMEEYGSPTQLELNIFDKEKTKQETVKEFVLHFRLKNFWLRTKHKSGPIPCVSIKMGDNKDLDVAIDERDSTQQFDDKAIEELSHRVLLKLHRSYSCIYKLFFKL